VRELERVKQLAASQAYQARPVEDAKREVAEAQAELDTARSLVKVRQAAYDRSKRLVDAGLASKREVETTEADLGEARAKEAEATTHLQIARQTLTREESIAKQDLYSLGEYGRCRGRCERRSGTLSTRRRSWSVPGGICGSSFPRLSASRGSRSGICWLARRFRTHSPP